MGRNTAGDRFVSGICRIQKRRIHFCSHIAGGQCVDIDSLGCPLVAECLGQLCNAALGCRISRYGKSAEEGKHGCDVDDLALALLCDKGTGCSLAPVKHCVQIYFHYVVPVLYRKLLAGMTALNAGAIDKNIQMSSQSLHCFIKSFCSVLGIAKIHLQTVAVKSLTAKLFCNTVYLIRRANDHNLCACFHQSLCHSVAKASCSAGYDCFSSR